jgi:hypothetical protein
MGNFGRPPHQATFKVEKIDTNHQNTAEFQRTVLRGNVHIITANGEFQPVKIPTKGDVMKVSEGTIRHDSDFQNPGD